MTTRNQHGQIERDIEHARLDAEAADLRLQGLTYPQIAEQMGCAVSTAHSRVMRAIEAVPYDAVEKLREIELARLDHDERAIRKIMEKAHYKVDHGRVIEIDGEHMDDHMPILQCIDRLRGIREQRAKYTGAFQPEQHEVTHYDGDSDLDREIAGLLEDMAGLGEGETAVAPSGAPSSDNP